MGTLGIKVTAPLLTALMMKIKKKKMKMLVHGEKTKIIHEHMMTVF